MPHPWCVVCQKRLLVTWDFKGFGKVSIHMNARCQVFYCSDMFEKPPFLGGLFLVFYMALDFSHLKEDKTFLLEKVVFVGLRCF